MNRSEEVLDWINRYGILKECNERQQQTILGLKKASKRLKDKYLSALKELRELKKEVAPLD